MSPIKNFLLTLFFAAGLATGVACDAEEIIDCTDLCDELDSCFDEGFGVIDCIDSCEEQAEATIDACDRCLDESERECADCTGVCSVFIQGGF